MSRPERATETEGRLGVILTGGTIGARTIERNGHRTAEQSEPDRAIDLVRQAAASLAGGEISVCQPVRRFSEDLLPADWVRIARAIRRQVEVEDARRVLVLHGTDTMTYTAAALCFLLADLAVPVVLTGANIPPNERDSDARKNIHDALLALRHVGPGAYVAFAGSATRAGWVHLGTRVRKVRTSGRTFVSIGCRPVAKVVGENFVSISPTSSPDYCGQIACAVEERVLAVRLFPGLDLGALHTWSSAAGLRGVVIELYASATAPTRGSRHSLARFVRACQRDRAMVVTTSPPSAIEGAPRRIATEYPSVAALRDAGALFLANALTETATVKLMWALAQSRDPTVVRALMRRSIAHEILV